jgi:hypothetical protein
VLHFKTPDGSNCFEKKPNPERVMNVFRHNVRIYCKLPVVWRVWGMWRGDCTRKTYTETNYKVEQVITNSANVYSDGTCVRENVG